MLSRVIGIIFSAFMAAAALGVSSAAAAQESTIIYSTHPAGIAEYDNGRLLLLPQPNPGEFVVTVSAVRGVYQNGAFISTTGIGTYTTTLKILGACSVGGGCDAFGIGANTVPIATRRANFAAMNLETLRQFIASGANVNGYAVSEGATINFYLPYLFAAAGKAEHVSVMLSAGASVNAKDDRSNTMLHFAAAAADDTAFSVIIALPGLDWSIRGGSGNQSPLDDIAQLRRNDLLANPNNATTTRHLIARARTMRLNNAVCLQWVNLRDQYLLCHPPVLKPELPGNANKIFIARNSNITAPGIIGILTTPPPEQ